jgi:hypothetical protein
MGELTNPAKYVANPSNVFDLDSALHFTVHNVKNVSDSLSPAMYEKNALTDEAYGYWLVGNVL